MQSIQAWTLVASYIGQSLLACTKLSGFINEAFTTSVYATSSVTKNVIITTVYTSSIIVNEAINTSDYPTRSIRKMRQSLLPCTLLAAL